MRGSPASCGGAPGGGLPASLSEGRFGPLFPDPPSPAWSSGGPIRRIRGHCVVTAFLVKTTRRSGAPKGRGVGVPGVGGHPGPAGRGAV